MDTMSLELVIIFIALGVFVGIMAGLLGIGGGGILVPVLTTIFIYQGVPKDSVVHLALGTSMACIALTAFSSMRAHHANGAVVWSLVKVMAGGVIVGAFCATFVTAQLSSKALAIFFAQFMAYVSWQMFRPIKLQPGSAVVSHAELGLVSLGIGVISALVSIGGGSLSVPYLSWRNIDIRHAIGTSAALGLCIALAGSLGYLINGQLQAHVLTNKAAYTWGYIYMPAVLLVSIPSYFSAPLGAKLTQRLPIAMLKKVFGVMLILLSLKMLFSIL
jgi:uncharacterized membrane protein YfcA